MVRSRRVRCLSACLLALAAGCGGDPPAPPDPGARADGRFLMDFSESLFAPGTPHPPCAETLVLAGSEVSMEDGCDPVQAAVRATEGGLDVEARWDRCGARGGAGEDPGCTFEDVRLRAASRMTPSGPDPSILEGAISSSGLSEERRFRACRVEGPRPSAPACSSPAVETSSGPVCGLARSVEAPGPGGWDRRSVHAYLGVRYATAGRWEDPAPYTSDVPARATQFGHACPQSVKNTARENQSEDCLTLNVWAPQDAGQAPLPVMVFLHGGGFIANASFYPVYDGAHLAAAGPVVVVTLNYRLGALGFLGGGTGTGRLHGNYGFLDQIEALRWVRGNIRNFGGDPGRVTLFGQSAGAMSIGLHLISPASRGLFRAAVMESNPYGIPYKRQRHADLVRQVFEMRAGCLGKGLDCLKDLPVWPACSCKDGKQVESRSVLGVQGDIVMWVLPFVAGGLSEMMPWAPTIDGDLVPGPPTDAERIRGIGTPLLAGTNRDEGAMFVGAIPEGTRITRLQYVTALRLLFGARWVDRILERERYRATRGDNLTAMVRVTTDYLWTCPNRRVMREAGLDVPGGSLPVFGYRFDHVPSYLVTTSPPSWLCQPSAPFVCHSHELPFVFHNPRTTGVPGRGRCIVVNHRFEDAESRLSETLVRHWTHFATHLAPYQDAGDPWPLFQDAAGPGVRAVLGGQAPRTQDREANCDLWDEIGYDLTMGPPVLRPDPDDRGAPPP